MNTLDEMERTKTMDSHTKNDREVKSEWLQVHG